MSPAPAPEEHALLVRASRERNEAQVPLISGRPTLGERIRVRLAWQVSHARNCQIGAELVHELAGGAPGSICVLGPRNDPMIAPLKARGHRVTVVDSETVVPPAASPAHGDHRGGPTGGQPFDVIILAQRLQTSPDPLATVEACRDALKPGGYFLADVPNHNSHAALGLGPAWYFHDAGCAVNFLTGRGLIRLVEGRGLTKVDLLYCNYTVQFRGPRLEIERKIWDGLYGDGGGDGERRPPRNSTLGQWKRLAGSLFKAPDEMYEVVAVVARRNE